MGKFSTLRGGTAWTCRFSAVFLRLSGYPSRRVACAFVLGSPLTSVLPCLVLFLSFSSWFFSGFPVHSTGEGLGAAPEVQGRLGEAAGTFAAIDVCTCGVAGKRRLRCRPGVYGHGR